MNSLLTADVHKLTVSAIGSKDFLYKKQEVIRYIYKDDRQFDSN
jgi:hypothetical protein